MNSNKFIVEKIYKTLQIAQARTEPSRAESKQTGITYLSFFIFVVEK